MSKKELAIGVLGAGGNIGHTHSQNIATYVDGARLAAVYDLNTERAEEVAKTYGAKVMASAEELIASPEIDAVVIASWDGTHADLAVKCIEAGKPVFCEKPLASTLEDCSEVLKDEIASGKHLVQVGFMRRFDPGYLEMKSIIDSGKLGKPLMVHCKSRTPVTPPKHTTRMHATNVIPHEIDVLRWLLDDEFDQAQVIMGRSSCYAPEGLQDPQLMLLTTKQGVVVDVEVAVNAHYGYDIQCEVVCENGTVSLPQPARAAVRVDESFQHAIMNDWSKRFVEAYQDEFQTWVDSCLENGGVPTGSNAWDGFVACVVADKLADAQDTKLMEAVELPERPAFYQA